MCSICGILNTNTLIETDKLLSVSRVLRHRCPNYEVFILGDTERNIYK